MSREQDLLFCKIAISSGKVAQEVAQKCFALANKMEAEGRQRPQVGAIFLKQNLLTTEDVQRIYGAVRKRMEVHGGGTAVAAPRQRAPQALPQAGAGRQRASGRAAPAAAATPGAVKAIKVSHRPVQERIDPFTLWSGIIFGLVAVACVLGIVFMLT